MNRSRLALLVSSLALPAHGHIRLDFPTSRHPVPTVEDGSNMKSAPCGAAGDSRTSDPTRVSTFTAGETITVRWRETIHHPSHYRIAFDDEGQDDFVDPTDPTDIVDPPALPVLLDGIPDESASPDEFSVAVTLPEEPCERCTLQLIQYMYDNARSPLYYQCADIVLLPPGAGAGSGGAPGSGGEANGSGGGENPTTGSGGAEASGGSSAQGGSLPNDDDGEVPAESGCQLAAPGAVGSTGGLLLWFGVLGSALGRRRKRRLTRASGL